MTIILIVISPIMKSDIYTTPSKFILNVQTHDSNRFYDNLLFAIRETIIVDSSINQILTKFLDYLEVNPIRHLYFLSSMITKK